MNIHSTYATALVESDESERGEWKAGLKLNIKKLKSWHLVPSLHGK